MADQFTFRNAIGNAINSQPYWQPNRYTQLYGNRPAQFADINSQTGASMNANISPQPFVPPWAVQNLPGRLQGPGYLNGGSVGNYGGMFGQKWGNGPRGVGNPYPGNGFGLTNMMMYPQALQSSGLYPQNPFLQGTPTPMGPGYQYQTPTQAPQQPTDPTTTPTTPTSPSPGPTDQGQSAPRMTAQSIDPNGGLLGMDRYRSQALALQPSSNPTGGPLETAPSTLDPGSMSGLLAWMGYGDWQNNAQQYADNYLTRFPSGQAPGGGTNYYKG